MVARILYATVSAFFFLLAMTCWLVAAAAVAAQLQAGAVNAGALCAAILSPLASIMAVHGSADAWRAARYHHVRYD